MAKKIQSDDETIYHGVSGFVPGLPAECSLKQARELGMEGELRAAIENGNYVLPRSVAAETAPPPALTLPSPKRRGDKKEN